jgi:hypothetical protein
MKEQRWGERRQHAHVKVRGAVILRSAGHVVHGTAMNVSATTLEVRCDPGYSRAKIDRRLHDSALESSTGNAPDQLGCADPLSVEQARR